MAWWCAFWNIYIYILQRRQQIVDKWKEKGEAKKMTKDSKFVDEIIMHGSWNFLGGHDGQRFKQGLAPTSY